MSLHQMVDGNWQACATMLTRAAPQHSTCANLSGARSFLSDPDPKRKLKDLDARLSAYRAAQKPEKAHQEEHYSQANVAWRMVTEMVAGLGLGFGIGYGLDLLLGTAPLMMVVFTLLGLAAGINVMLRTAKEIQARQEAGPDAGHKDSARDTGANDGSPAGRAQKGSPDSRAQKGKRDGD